MTQHEQKQQTNQGDSFGSTGEYYEFTHRLDGGAHSEADAIAALRDNTRALYFTDDPDLDDSIREQLQAHDAKKTPNPEQPDERDRRDFADEFAKNLINRLQEQAADEGFTDHDGEPLKLWYAGDTKHVKDIASKLYQDNEGELKVYGAVNGIKATVGMTTEHFDYDDGLVEDYAYDLESEVRARRMENSIREELPNFSMTSGHTELSSDGNGREGKIQLNREAFRDLQERMAAARDELGIAKGKP